jgi:hypothetical protein
MTVQPSDRFTVVPYLFTFAPLSPSHGPQAIFVAALGNSGAAVSLVPRETIFFKTAFFLSRALENFDRKFRNSI